MTTKTPADPGTLEAAFDIPLPYHDVLIAELADLGFSAFQERDGRLYGYCPADVFGRAQEESINSWLARNGFAPIFDKNTIAARNWNADWERSIHPVRAGRFVVLPSTYKESTLPGELIPIWIDPKMSFGTGHHETTQLVLECLPDVLAAGDRVLDIGTGTGVLAIAAVKLGAAAADACDTDPWASENAPENIEANAVESFVRFFSGSIDDVPRDAYDVVLANIQFNVLSEMLSRIHETTRPGGRVILSGLLGTDSPAMQNLARGRGFAVGRIKTAGEWVAMCLKRPS